MIVSKQDLNNFGLLKALPDKLKSMDSGDYFVFYYDVDELNVKLKVFEYDVVKEPNFGLYRGLEDKQQQYRSEVKVGFFGNTFDTKDGLFFQFLKTYNDKNDVFAFYNKIIEQDKVVDLSVSINAITDIYNSDGFRRAISYFSPTRIQPIMFVYDMVDASFRRKLGKSLYADTIKQVVNMIKFEGGVLPEWDKSKMRFMIIGPHADLTKDQKDRLDLANKLLRSGNKIIDIYSQTGWALGEKDGKWRTNIADNEAELSFNKMTLLSGKRLYIPEGATQNDVLPLTLNPTLLYAQRYKGKLGDVLKHPTLYQYYPWLHSMPLVYFFQDEALGMDAQTTQNNKDSQDFYFSPNERGGFILINGSYLAGDSLSILLHEIQHSIQNKEGYATGGNLFLAQFVSSVGSNMVRKIFAAINKMEHLFRDNCRNDSSRTELKLLLKEMYLHSTQSDGLRNTILSFLDDQSIFEENVKSITFYLAILLSEEGDFTSRLFEFLQGKLGDFLYEIIQVISEGYASAKNYEQYLNKELGYSKGTFTKDGRYKKGDIDTILFKGYENLYGEMESRSVQSSRYVQTEYKNYFYLTHWELGPLRNLTVIDGVEEVIDCQKIKGACESKGDEYVLHFEKDEDVRPFIHELGHIVYDALVRLGYEPRIIAEYDKQFAFTSGPDDYFVEKFIGYIKDIVVDDRLAYDMSMDLNIKSNPVINEILDEFFKDTDVDKRVQFLNKMLSLINE